MIAISVDSPSISDALRRQLRLPFPILCDTQRRVLREWNILNEEERGGIAKPSVFIIDPDGVIRFQSIDRTATRVPAATVVNFLFTGMRTMPSQPRRKKIIPGLISFYRALRNNAYFAFRRR